MDALTIGIIIFGVIFIAGGLIAGNYAAKVSREDDGGINKVQKK